MDGYFLAGELNELLQESESSTSKEYQCVPINIPNHPQKRVNLISYKSKLYAILNVCPHQGAPFHKGRVSDIEDMGGSQISCVLHNWAFSLEDGKSASNTFVVDVYNVKLMDGNQVYISLEPKNSQIEGQRRDFNGSELIYNPGLGWI